MNISDLKVKRRLLEQRRDELLKEVQSPDFNADARENSNRDATLRDLQDTYDQLSLIDIEISRDGVQYIPGTIGVGIPFNIKYLRVVSNGIEKQLPKPQKMVIVNGFEVIDVFKKTTEAKPISELSAVGKAILNKIPGIFVVNTANGFVEVEVYA